MHQSRRHFVLTSLAALAAAGCESTQTTSGNPTTPWGTVPRPPEPSGTVYRPAEPAATASADPLHAIARSSWTTTPPDASDTYPMNGVARITIHHDGMARPISTTNYAASADYLELIRRSHRNRGWADIGYHYAIDKAGRIWAARSTSLQGAHVKDQNEHNLGILVMGNFNVQQPTDAQMSSLVAAVGTLRRTCRVAPNRIYTHREIGQTDCPGANLQPKVAALRSRNAFA